jgi:4-alpha-glucanotransferase
MENLTELAELAGISSSYVDKTGVTRNTSDAVRKVFLTSMGYDISSDEQIRKNIVKLRQKQVIDDVLAFFDNEPIKFTVSRNGTFDITLIDEKQRIAWHTVVDGFTEINVTDLAYGYYDLRVESADFCCESLLIYAPHTAYQPEFIRQKEHIFGTAVMLYALRSPHNMGIGDFADLKEIVRLTAQAGGDVVGINPLGIMSPLTQKEELAARPFNVDNQNMQNVFLQSDVSPYRTISRLFVNYAYLDLASEEDFLQSEKVKKYINSPEIKENIRRLREADKVEYAAVLNLKLNILTLMFEHFQNCATGEAKRSFAEYAAEKGNELTNLCTFEVLLEVLYPEDFWRYWPSVLADASSVYVEEFRQLHAGRIEFYKYCHWLADKQIKAVQKYAETLGMKIGLYADMPIGAASNGAEVWENPKSYVLDAGIGAPADPMRPRGQSWGFTPYHPQTLRRQHYAPFIRLVRENMQYAGALRIDHAMGLQRLFWGFFAKDNPVVQGAYVYYNLKEMTAVINIESNRRKCMVIGEDLGTVPDGFREYIAQHGLLSYKVFCRQKEKDGSFIRPEKYMYMSLAQTSTHDQATACGFWLNEDIEVFKKCGLYVNDEQYCQNLRGRQSDRINMLKAFANMNMLAENDKKQMEKTVEKGDFAPDNIHILLNRYGAATNSALFLVRLNDIYRQIVLDNAPGTVKEYPNWRIKMNKSINEIANSPEFIKMMSVIKENRPR